MVFYRSKHILFAYVALRSTCNCDTFFFYALVRENVSRTTFIQSRTVNIYDEMVLYDTNCYFIFDIMIDDGIEIHYFLSNQL